MNYKYQIIEKDWYKRRKPDTSNALPLTVKIPNFVKLANHMCKMEVTFDDGSTKELIARVIQNRITKQWTVDGMEVAVRVIES